MRALLPLTLVLGALALPVAAIASVRPDPYAYAYGATLKYIDSSTKSCAEQHPQRGGQCTQYEPFSVTMQVLRRDHYRIEIANARAVSNFAYFAWILPDGMTLRRIARTHEGSCGIRQGMIACTRQLKAHGCGCAQRDLVVDFTATGREPTHAKGGYWIYYGFVAPYLDQAPPFTDASFCDIGQKSTKQHPCVK